MTMRFKVVCDTCRSDELYGKTHIAVTFHPRHMTGAKELHFCNTGCLMRFGTNMQAHEAEGIEFIAKKGR